MIATLERRARQSLGSSHEAIYRMVEHAFDVHGVKGGLLVDVGCGSGGLWHIVGHRFSQYIGLDAIRYDGFPAAGALHVIDLDAARWPLAEGCADVVVAVETIEHLENPWAFMRSLAGLARPGGWAAVTTPNQLSALSLITLALKSRFSAFQDSHYPAYKTALLGSDLRRAALEAGLEPSDVTYSLSGRLPLSGRHYPAAIARLAPRLLSDNLMLLARKRTTLR
jgi:2-polyprenyl-3-methyl-5-hydroxy-6-metoxy-1,4-benzoquinol methylase